MKKLNHIISLIALTLVLFAIGCGSSGDDDDDAVPFPTILITSDHFDETLTATGNPGSIVIATIDITAPGGFNTMRITKTGGEDDASFPYEETREVDTTAITTHMYSLVYSLIEAEAEETVNFIIEAVDDLDQTTEVTLTLITEAVPETPARVYSAILLAAPLSDRSSETFFSTSSGMIYSSNTVTSSAAAISTTIDFGYYYGDPSGAHLASSEAFLGVQGLKAQVNGWNTLNNITFKRTEVTEEMFLEVVSWEDIDEIYKEAAAIDTPGNIAGLVIGDVITFLTDSDKTGGAKKGLIFVNNLNPGAGANGSIELDIIVQETPVE